MFDITDLFDLLTLTGLEIVLGIDNIVFLALLIQKVKPEQRQKAKFVGVFLALFLRVAFLCTAHLIAKWVEPLFWIFNLAISGRDLLLFFGGLFLFAKAGTELYKLIYSQAHATQNKDNLAKKKTYNSFLSVISQIIFVDFVMSFDSVLTAVGIADNLLVMIIAITIAMIVMLCSVEPIGKFIDRYPSVKIIAICFVMLIGMYLLLSGLHIEMSKTLLYLVMAFSLFVEFINIKTNTRHVN